MIYTVTFNPALDYVISVPDFQMGRTNRTVSEQIFPGGKGINVSIVLGNLGIDTTALGFTAGFTGEEIKRHLALVGVKTDFIQVKQGLTRINVKIKDVDGTEINGCGPVIGEEELVFFRKKLRGLTREDMLVLAGSIPGNIEDTIYRDIVKELSKKRIPVVVDATKELLLQTLPYKPFLIKPNHYEIEELFGVTMRTKEEIIESAKKLRKMGAVNVLVSMSKDGAILVDGNGNTHVAVAPKGKLVNAVGAGDSMVAGFLAGWVKKRSYDFAFRMGVAAGSASAFSEKLATKEEIGKLLQRIIVENND